MDFLTSEVDEKNLKRKNWFRNSRDLLRNHTKIKVKIVLRKPCNFRLEGSIDELLSFHI